MVKSVTTFQQSCRSAVAIMGGVCVALSFLPATTWALDSQAVWQGIATTTAATAAQCAGVGGAGFGDAEVSVFRPKIKSTDTATFLSFYFLRGAFTLENLSESTVHQMHGNGRADIFGVNGRAKFLEGAATYSLTITPATIVASTPVVKITGKINNYFDVAGCDVTFTGVYALRPN